MRAATCIPGQDPTYAVAPTAVILVPEPGGDFGSSQGNGSVRLISKKNTSLGADLEVVTVPAPSGPPAEPVPLWTSDAVCVSLPLENPGARTQDEQFQIKITTDGGTEYFADPVNVTGLAQYGWPPCHSPVLGLAAAVASYANGAFGTADLRSRLLEDAQI